MNVMTWQRMCEDAISVRRHALLVVVITSEELGLIVGDSEVIFLVHSMVRVAIAIAIASFFCHQFCWTSFEQSGD
jgi:hypothetical protein